MFVSRVNVANAYHIQVAGRDVLTAIGKRSIDGRVAVGPLGLAGDEQADPTVHGGLGKAVCAYPLEHYAFWQRVRAQAGLAALADPPASAAPRAPPRDCALPRWDAAMVPLAAGAFGENLTLSGLLESQVWVGDLLRFAGCTLAVSEPRTPCFKFDAAMGFKQATQLMAQSGWCGFYLAVRVPGWLQAGEAFELVAGPREVSISELFRARVPTTRR